MNATSSSAAPTIAAKQKAGSKSLRDIAYETIKKQIITCKLQPGQALSEAHIAHDIGIGRTPVHQALDRLRGDGLVEILPRKGVIVHPVSLDEILEIIDVRLINENACVRRAAEIASPSAIANLNGNLAQMARAVKQHDTEDMMNLDRAFHIVVSSSAGNSVQSEIMRTLHERSLRFWFISLRAPNHYKRVHQQHEAIVDAISSHDPHAAEQAMREHIEAFRDNIMNQV